MTLGTGLIVGGGAGVGHPSSGDEFHHYYRQALAPTASDPLEVGDLWSDTTANLLKRCTSLSPITFVSVEGSSASETSAGLVELATQAEVDTGTDAARVITPDTLAGSVHGIKYVQLVPFDFTADNATGDGAFFFHIPAAFNGMNLVEVHAEVVTAGTTNTEDIQIANVTQSDVDMLSTKLTIDSAETGSDTAATAAVIDLDNDDVATNDLLRVDVDAVHTTAAKGLIVTLGFQLP